tara:strand:- start:363 stop:533 length:171 start_codon:yes stop_codon:yes gene_type:complete
MSDLRGLAGKCMLLVWKARRHILPACVGLQDGENLLVLSFALSGSNQARKGRLVNA